MKLNMRNLSVHDCLPVKWHILKCDLEGNDHDAVIILKKNQEW